MIKKIYVVLAAVALAAGGALPATAAEERDLKTEPAEFMASGDRLQDRLGRSIAFGDIDDDGFADLASGAPLDEPLTEEVEDNRGALHVYFGKSNFGGTSSTPDLIIWGEEGCTPGTGCNEGNNDDSDVLGKGVAMGDVNDDGKADLIVSAVRAKKTAGVEGGRVGKVYIFFGRASWPSEIDLAADPGQADVRIIGEFHQSDFGIHIDTGDFDDDGIRDIVVGAASVHATVAPGAVWVLYGRKSWPAEINLQVEPNPAATLEVNGAAGNDMLGHAVAAGDMNADGIADIAAGAPFGGGGCQSGDPGKAYVIFGAGSRVTGTKQLTEVVDVTVESDDPGDELGRRLSVGDVGGTATRDLILGAPCGDASGKTDTGIGYVLFGTLTAGTKDVDTANLKVFGENAGDGLGVGTGVGDHDDDGKGDLILGAEGGDGPDEARTEAGEVVVFSGPVGTGTRDLAVTSADLTVYGADKDDHLGVFVGAGNVDDAAGDDLGMTAPHGEGLVGEPQAGEVHVVLSECDIQGTAASETLVGTAASETICGAGGNDTLLGKGGKDVLKGGPGNDTLDGGGGNDTMEGEAGGDTLLGRKGKDTGKGGGGKDTVKGGGGADTVIGNAGNDVLRGNGGNDNLQGGPGKDNLNGGAGTDSCNGGGGADVVKNCE